MLWIRLRFRREASWSLTVQGYTAVAVADDKHQVIVEGQAHRAPQEQELLQPMLSDLQESFQDQDLSDNIFTGIQTDR